MRLWGAGSLAVLTVITAGHAPTAAAVQDAPADHFVVLNLAGPNFADIQARPELLDVHRNIYRAFEAECLTLVGGALRGDTVLGMTIFRPGVDEQAIRRRVEADPTVIGGSIKLDYRRFQIQMGSLPPSRPDCQA